MVEKDAIAQVASGAGILDINSGVVYNSNPNPNETEPPLMTNMVKLVQGLVDTPLCIDSSVPDALEAGLQAAEGRPLLNSVTGEEERLERVLPLVKKYNVPVVEMEIAGIYGTAAEYGAEAVAMCTVSDEVRTGKGLTVEERQGGFDEMIKVALTTVANLER